MMQPKEDHMSPTKKNGLNLEGSIAKQFFMVSYQLVGNHPFPSKKTGWKCLEFQVNLIS